MVILQMLFSVVPDKRYELLQAIEMIKKDGKREPAQTSCELYEAVGKTNRFLLVETWGSSEALDAYMRTDRYRSLLGAIAVLGRLEDVQMAEPRPLGETRNGSQ